MRSILLVLKLIILQINSLAESKKNYFISLIINCRLHVLSLSVTQQISPAFYANPHPRQSIIRNNEPIQSQRKKVPGNPFRCILPVPRAPIRSNNTSRERPFTDIRMKKRMKGQSYMRDAEKIFSASISCSLSTGHLSRWRQPYPYNRVCQLFTAEEKQRASGSPVAPRNESLSVLMGLKFASLECNEIIYYDCLKILNNGNFIYTFVIKLFHTIKH